jgi:hypothetical protein
MQIIENFPHLLAFSHHFIGLLMILLLKKNLGKSLRQVAESERETRRRRKFIFHLNNF